MKKQSITFLDAAKLSLRALGMNAAKTCTGDKNVDRMSRLKGNLIGLKDIVTGQSRPEKAAEL
jgi:hypothetical protein